MAKIGAGHAAAMGRLGLAELRALFNPSPGAATDKEVGLYGTLTQGEIADARQDDGPSQEREPESLQGLRAATQAAAKEDARDRDGPDPSRGKEL